MTAKEILSGIAYKAFLIVSLALLLFPVRAGANKDTIFFVYDKAKSELKISSNVSREKWFPCMKGDMDNELTKHLIKKLGTQNTYRSANQTYYSLDVVNNTMTVKLIDELWDSGLCARMVVSPLDPNTGEIITNTVIPTAVAVVNVPVAVETADSAAVQDSNGKGKFPLPYIVIAIVLALVVALVAVLMVTKKKKNVKQQESIKKAHALEVVEVVENKQIQGLDFINADKSSYYHIDLTKDFADTAVRNIYMHHSVVKKMYDFFKASLASSELTNETGCYFVGCWEYADAANKSYNISLEDIVEPGDDLEPGEFSFNFGLKIGVKLNATIEKLSTSTGRDYVHTVWMHSHPGLGLFLSSHDLVVQRQLAYSDAKTRLVAFVVDTNTPNLDLAIFSAKSDGTMNNKEDLSRLYSLEELYQWCRKAHIDSEHAHSAVEERVETPTVDLENYHPVQINHQGNRRTLNAYFNGRVINAIDDIIYDCGGKATLAAIVIGKRDERGNLVVEDCVPTDADAPAPPDAIGPLIVDAEVSEDNLTTKYPQTQSSLCIFLARDDDHITILARDTTDAPFPPIDNAATCSMKPLKEWMRRRRIYK